MLYQTLGMGSNFLEKLAEYAYATSLDKQMIHIVYAFHITKDCDCHGIKLNPMTNDIEVFVSNDPVAVDKAVLDMLNKDREIFTKDIKH